VAVRDCVAEGDLAVQSGRRRDPRQVMVDELDRKPTVVGNLDRLNNQNSTHRVAVVHGEVNQHGAIRRQQPDVRLRRRR